MNRSSQLVCVCVCAPAQAQVTDNGTNQRTCNNTTNNKQANNKHKHTNNRVALTLGCCTCFVTHTHMLLTLLSCFSLTDYSSMCCVCGNKEIWSTLLSLSGVVLCVGARFVCVGHCQETIVCVCVWNNW